MGALRLLLGLSFFIAPLAGAAAQESAGVAAQVRNQVVGEVGGAAARNLGRGDRVFRNEKVTTGDASALNVLFLDETSLSVGPNSTIVLDEMVYDPVRNQGKVVLSVGVGVTRFVSGILPKADYEIRTPTLIVGVRGTTVDFYVRPNGDSTAVLRAGEMTARDRLRPQGSTVQVTTPGLSVTGTTGAPPGPPGPVPADAARAFTQLPGSQVDLATNGRAPAPVTGSPIPERSYRDAISNIGNNGPDKKCSSNGTHNQGGSGC